MEQKNARSNFPLQALNNGLPIVPDRRPQAPQAEAAPWVLFPSSEVVTTRLAKWVVFSLLHQVQNLIQFPNRRFDPNEHVSLLPGETSGQHP